MIDKWVDKMFDDAFAEAVDEDGGYTIKSMSNGKVVSITRFLHYSKDNFISNEYNVINMVQSNNPKFSSARFKQKAYACLRYVFFSYVKADPSICRSFVTDKMYKSICNEIEKDKEKASVRIVERFVIDKMFLSNYVSIDGIERLGFHISIGRRDYYKNNGEVRCSDFLDKPKTMSSFYLEFVKNVGVEHVNEIVTTNCPNCGAVLNIDANGVCDYCKESVTTGKYCWILDKMCYWDERFDGDK